jgi:predicted tellurium resistance membrane protein TerC
MLTALEIVLGIDNIIFISILVGRCRPELRDKARRWAWALPWCRACCCCSR